MTFAHADYFRACFAVPLGISLFTTVIAIGLVVGVLKDRNSRKDKIGAIGIVAVIVCFWVLYPAQNVGILIHGGIHLVHESEVESVELQGTIEEIESLGDREFPYTNLYTETRSHGIRFVIDRIPYAAFAKGDFEVGDQVYVRCLPRSGYILSISKE